MKKSSLTNLTGGSLDFITKREHHAAASSWLPEMASTSFFAHRMDKANSLYKKDLFSHFGCVNAIEFSTDGNLLISGGDDKRVLLWNIESSISGNQKPKQMKGQHSSNIFCLSFDSQNAKIFSAGNDSHVIVHDVNTGETVNVFLHEEAVYGVSVNPSVHSIFASAGEDGQVLLYDLRAPPTADPLSVAQYYDSCYSVQFHPLEPVYILTANAKLGVGLWDVRKPRVPVLRYGELKSQSSMCAKFNSNGSQIVALRRRLPPVLYNTECSSTVCEFDAEHYYNSCTMKSCCFAGSRDQYILSGSDDFNLYMWEIPDHGKFQYVAKAHMVLRGHRSIVNQVRFNSQRFLIASSGVEKLVKLWSPVPLPGTSGGLKSTLGSPSMPRKFYTHEEYIGLLHTSEQSVSHDYSDGCTEEDPRMMAFFDALVQREVEGWTTNTDISDDDDDDVLSDGDTTTTASQASSLPTSQSDSDTDGNMQDTFETESLDSSFIIRASSSSTAAPLPIRKRRSWQSQLEGPSKRRRKLSGSGNSPETKSGNDWIFRLIAKKRAQLRAAKREKRRRRLLGKKFFKHHYIKCSLRNNRLLYQPSVIRKTRHSVAPYTTVRTMDENQDGDASDDDEDTSQNNPNSSSTLNSSSRHKVYLKLWSSDSSCSSDNEEMSRSKRPPSSRNKRQLSCDKQRYSIVSDILDFEDSENEDLNKTCFSGTLNDSKVLTDSLSKCDGDSSNFSHTNNLVLSDIQSPLDINTIEDSTCSPSKVIPIKSISTDESGSVLFELNSDHSLNATLHIDPSNNYSSPTTSPFKDANDSNNKSYGESSSNAGTPDSGISMSVSNSEKKISSNLKKEKENTLPCTSNENDDNSIENPMPNSSADFSIKKQILKSRLKSYRPRLDDD